MGSRGEGGRHKWLFYSHLPVRDPPARLSKRKESTDKDDDDDCLPDMSVGGGGRMKGRVRGELNESRVSEQYKNVTHFSLRLYSYREGFRKKSSFPKIQTTADEDKGESFRKRKLFHRHHTPCVNRKSHRFFMVFHDLCNYMSYSYNVKREVIFCLHVGHFSWSALTLSAHRWQYIWPHGTSATFLRFT